MGHVFQGRYKAILVERDRYLLALARYVVLNPLRAKISLGMRVLSVNDLGFNHKGGNLFLVYQQQKEQFAKLSASALGALGITGIP